MATKDGLILRPSLAPRGAKTPSAAEAGEFQTRPGGFGFVLLCAFICSFLLHLPSRIPALGAIRLDMLLGLGAMGAMVLSGAWKARPDSQDKTLKRLVAILIFIVVTLPFVQWPGTVVKFGLEQFLKSLFFYFLVVGLVNTERRLQVFLLVFLGCQVFRVVEPLYLHLTDGYWGSSTNMGNWESMDRLSGAPSDSINPNGLAQLVLETVAMLGCLLWPRGRAFRLVFLSLGGLFFYVLLLTGSRSGFLVFALMVLYAVWRSRYRTVAIAAVAIAASFFLGLMTDMQKERYLSIVSPTAKGAGTAEGRIEGVKSDFLIALKRPLFGYGLGTSLEANFHARGRAQPSHNLFTETAQELGFVGLGLFLALLAGTISNCRKVGGALPNAAPDNYLFMATQAVIALITVNLVFAMASYGLSEYRWYLMAGLSAALLNLTVGPTAVGKGEGQQVAAVPRGTAADLPQG